eukprot:SAG11_NODE_5596_length_1514_cov_1.370318_1_plen_176_part_00
MGNGGGGWKGGGMMWRERGGWVPGLQLRRELRLLLLRQRDVERFDLGAQPAAGAFALAARAGGPPPARAVADARARARARGGQGGGESGGGAHIAAGQVSMSCVKAWVQTSSTGGARCTQSKVLSSPSHQASGGRPSPAQGDGAGGHAGSTPSGGQSQLQQSRLLATQDQVFGSE